MLNDQISAALTHRKTKDFDSLLEELSQINNEHPENPIVLSLLAHAQWECGLNDEAIKNALWLISNDPQDESASITLFHCYISENRYNEAFSELKRFQSNDIKSEDYNQLENFLNTWKMKRQEFDVSDMNNFYIKGEKDEPSVHDNIIGPTESESDLDT